jgi:hypothetical protein
MNELMDKMAFAYLAENASFDKLWDRLATVHHFDHLLTDDEGLHELILKGRLEVR